jgi:2'-5' RNA ligase
VHLYAALVPPAAELDRARVVVAGVAPVPEPGGEALPDGRHRAGAGRRFGRRRDPGPPPPPTGPMLDLLPTAAMHLPIAKFGNLALTDSVRLADELERRAAQWPTPRLRLAGGVALEPAGDPSVRVKLAGDLEALSELMKGVARAAQALHLFVDRRMFRPEVELGMVNDRTTPAYLEALLADLDGFESNAWWQSTIALLIPAEAASGGPPYKVHREIPLGPAVAH